MEENQITIKNLKINYKVFGSGEPFIILHGWGSDSSTWQKVSEIIKDKNLKVIIPDLPGFGKSQEPDESWSMDSYVEWLNEFSEKIPELNNGFYLLGHSFGGALASKFTIKYNQKVKKLFLISASCIREKTFKKKFFPKVSKIFKVFSFMPFYDLFKKAFYKYVVGGQDYLNVEKTMKETFLKIVSEDLSNHLAFIRVPTVIIWGDCDKLTPLNQAEIINKKIENSKLVLIKDAKHAIQIQLPEVLANKILEELN